MTCPDLALRRSVVRDLHRAKAAAVMAGDGFLCELLGNAIARVNYAVSYAENQRAFAGRKMHGLPPRVNALDNRSRQGLVSRG